MTVADKVLEATKNFLTVTAEGKYDDPELQTYAEVLLRFIEDKETEETENLINSFHKATP